MEGVKKIISALLFSAIFVVILPMNPKTYGQQLPDPSKISLFGITIVDGYDAIFYGDKPNYKFVWFPYNDPTDNSEQEVWEYAISGNGGPSLALYTKRVNGQTVIEGISARPAPNDVPTETAPGVDASGGVTPPQTINKLPFNNPNMSSPQHYGSSNPYWYYPLTNDSQLDIFLADCASRYGLDSTAQANLRLMSRIARDQNPPVDLYDRGIDNNTKQQEFETKVGECYESLTKTNKGYLLPYTDPQNGQIFLDKLKTIKASLKKVNEGSDKVLARIDNMFSDDALSSGAKALSIITVLEDNNLFEQMYGTKNQYGKDAKTSGGTKYPGVMLTEKVAATRFLKAFNITLAATNQGTSYWYPILKTAGLFAFAIGGAGVGGLILGTFLGNKISNRLENGEIDKILKDQVKAYFMANYIMRNNEFNECLGKFGVTNPRLVAAAKSAAENPTAATGSDTGLCGKMSTSFGASGKGIGNAISYAGCWMLSVMYDGANWVFEQATKLLESSIGIIFPG